MRKTLLLVCFTALALPASAQSVDDGVMLADGEVVIADIYTHESWTDYWEGTLKRENGNIGTVTTRSNAVSGAYGVTDRLTVMAVVPRVWNEASMGVLHSMDGFQDFSLAAKYRLFEVRTGNGAVRGFVVGAAALPMADYTPDFYPLSIGSGSRRLSGRGTVSFEAPRGWFVNGSAAYTARGDVTLDRPYFFTDDVLTFSDVVDLANVFDYSLAYGYQRSGIMGALGVTQQHTLGGGDIRRQDAPFVSNRMNFTRLNATVVAPVPKLDAVSLMFQYGYVMSGRNVGQSKVFSGGVVYRLPFGSR